MNLRQRHAGFTLIELLVVVAVIVVLIAILMPALSRARTQAKMVACASNCRQIGVGFLLYANDYEGQLLNAAAWGTMTTLTINAAEAPYTTTLLRSTGPIDIRCPEGRLLPNSGSISGDKLPTLRNTYWFNASWYDTSSNWPYSYPPKIFKINNPARCVWLCCAWVRATTDSHAVVNPCSHATGRPVLYADGHVECRADYVNPLHDHYISSDANYLPGTTQYLVGIPFTTDGLKSN